MAKFGYLSLAAAAAAFLIGTSAAHAVVTAQFVSVGTPNVGSSLTPNPMTGYTGYVLRLTSSIGVVTGFDFSNVKITGPMAQRFAADSDFDNNPEQTPVGQNPSAGNNPLNADSHFINLSYSVGSPFVENLTDTSGTSSPYAGLNTPGGVTYGSGNSLGGAAGINAVNQAGSVDVAYIVVKDGDQVGFLGAAASEAIIGQASISNLITAATPATPPVPEPASLGVLALGGVALLARRRKA
jgi:hypothetical protein